jgi:hypothetical protein
MLKTADSAYTSDSDSFITSDSDHEIPAPDLYSTL